jgi:hypothetical protein
VFPAKNGGLHDRQWLAETFKLICEKAKITKRFTPTGARRTGETWYGRTSGTRLAMAISGHGTEAMHRHYGSADAEENCGRRQDVGAALAGRERTCRSKRRIAVRATRDLNSGVQLWGPEDTE